MEKSILQNVVEYASEMLKPIDGPVYDITSPVEITCRFGVTSLRSQRLGISYTVT